MVSYKPHTCNIPGCAKSEYKNHMCREHYDFYMQNHRVAKVVEEKAALESGKADWKLKLKRVLHTVIHLSFDYPMPLYEHFPLEHVYLTELNTIRGTRAVDIERYKRIKEDFDIPNNENIAAMERMLNIRDIETSELGAKEKYLLGPKDLPTMIPPMISVIGFLILVVLLCWLATPDFQIRGINLGAVEEMVFTYVPYVCAFSIFIILGRQVPYQYNFFVERSYNMTLYKSVEDNADLVNQVRYVKDRKSRAGTYYSTLMGSVSASVVCIFVVLLSGGTIITWQSILFALGVALLIVPLVYAYSEMALYYPVINCMKRKRVSIDLFNADKRGGLKLYHSFLYKVFFYSEGVSFVFIAVFNMMPIAKIWSLVLFVLLLPRFNHAGWAIIAWGRSLIDFHKVKSAEKAHLMVAPGTQENLAKMEALKKIHSTSIIPIFAGFVLIFLIPYLINHMPPLPELLKSIGFIRP